MKRTKLDMHHIFDIDFQTSSLVLTDLKIYLGLTTDTIQNYKLIIKIYGDQGTVLYFNTFEEQIFA